MHVTVVLLASSLCIHNDFATFYIHTQTTLQSFSFVRVQMTNICCIMTGFCGLLVVGSPRELSAEKGQTFWQ